MIIKNPDKSNTTNKFLRAGADAENQMAFYLKREFSDEPNVYVLNGIRLGYDYDTDYAQIDHLILHRYGMIIVESKSVIGTVFINELGEWSRKFDSLKGMASPIEQAKRQAAFLKKYLDINGPKLPSDLGIQRTFNKLPVDLIIAISDTAIIKRPPKLNIGSVCKADLVVNKIRNIINSYESKKGFLSVAIRPFILKDDSIKEIYSFLIQSHTPLKNTTRNDKEIMTSTKSYAKPNPEIMLPLNNNLTPRPLEKKEANKPSPIDHYHTCSKCGSKKLKILWSKYGYYFKCDDCTNNIPIKQSCPICDKKLKLRKDKNCFFIECAACKTSVLFYKNPY